MHDLLTAYPDVAHVSDTIDLSGHRPDLSSFEGMAVLPGDTDFNAYRALALSNRDDLPAILLRVANASDVAVALNYAREFGLDTAVRCGGHSTACHGSVSGGVIIDLRGLDSLEIAKDRNSVWAGAGLTAGAVTRALESHQLVVGFGDAASVGIGGLTLGGGIGYLVRKHGLTIDSLLAVELVTAAGEVLVADADNHPDLFWALRGGGGNFGVVTRFKFRLHSLPAFTGGPLILPATPKVLVGLVEAGRAAPDELSVIIQAMPAPPLPFLPPEVIGRDVIFAMLAFAGPDNEAHEALAPFRALAKPIADLVGPAPFSSMYLPEEPGPAPAVSVRTQFLSGFDEKAAAQALELLGQNEAPMHMIQIRVLGGAAARVPAEATAFAHRDAPLMVSFLAIDSPANLDRNEKWVKRGLDLVRKDGTGAYVNFLADEGVDRLREAYPGVTWDRLRAVKRRYDPQNIFHRNQNVPPAISFAD